MKARLYIPLALAAAAAGLVVPASAPAEWVVKGKGYGHGVGMSQYGAYGYAKEGRRYQPILRHYYKGTRIGNAKGRKVRVLITTGLGSVRFTGAREACGKRLKPRRRYSFGVAGRRVELNRPSGRRIKRCGKDGGARGGGSVVFSGVGVYRGKLIARNVGGSLYAINRLTIDRYVRGVVPNEVPASWPRHALRAQAVAARSYALATRVNGNGYDLYDDIRSQVYNGRSSEQRSTNRAVRHTAGEVVKAGTGIATTYFFSTSGGRTENSEFVWSSPRSYLKSVRDPFDDVSPVHKWRKRFSNAAMRSRLSGLYRGNLRRIKVLKTGRSPRIVRAKVIGSRGSSRVDGATLRSRLDLRSTWARFRKR